MKRILIVDDSPTILDILEATLKKNIVGYSIDRASDGIEALYRIKNNKYELMLTDINMPKKNGFQLVEEVRENNKYKKMKIIVVSTEGRRSDIVKMLRLGANSYIIKPFKVPELIEKITSLLETDSKETQTKESLLFEFIEKSIEQYIEFNKDRLTINKEEEMKIKDFTKFLKSSLKVDEIIQNLILKNK